MAPPQAPANGAVHGGSNGGVIVAGGGMAPSSENGADGAHHGGSIDGVVGGTTVPSSVAANGNGKQHGHGTRKRKKKPAVSPMDKYWTPIDDMEAAEAVEDGRRPLLFRTYRVKGILLHPYRCASTSGLKPHR
jgi:1,4-beta-D-xylan synthase